MKTLFLMIMLSISSLISFGQIIQVASPLQNSQPTGGCNILSQEGQQGLASGWNKVFVYNKDSVVWSMTIPPTQLAKGQGDWFVTSSNDSLLAINWKTNAVYVFSNMGDTIAQLMMSIVNDSVIVCAQYTNQRQFVIGIRNGSAFVRMDYSYSFPEKKILFLHPNKDEKIVYYRNLLTYWVGDSIIPVHLIPGASDICDACVKTDFISIKKDLYYLTYGIGTTRIVYEINGALNSAIKFTFPVTTGFINRSKPIFIRHGGKVYGTVDQKLVKFDGPSSQIIDLLIGNQSIMSLQLVLSYEKPIVMLTYLDTLYVNHKVLQFDSTCTLIHATIIDGSALNMQSASDDTIVISSSGDLGPPRIRYYTFDRTTGDEKKFFGEMKIIAYPNPAQDIITLEGYEDLNDAKIIDITGKFSVVEIINKTIDLTSFIPGIYTIQIGKRSIKLLKL